MLRSIEELEKYAIHATDGPIGYITDFYFDDESWVVRYLIVDTGHWLSGRKVLISPMSIGHVDPKDKAVQILLTRDQVRNSPDIDTDKPVSRQHEMGYLGYYGYPFYPEGNGMWQPKSFSDPTPANKVCNTEADYDQEEFSRAQQRIDGMSMASSFARKAAGKLSSRRGEDPHLRSCKVLLGYGIQATDGPLGSVAGFLVDEKNLVIRYLIVHTGHWWTGHKILVVPEWIDSVNWREHTVSVDLSREEVESAPCFHSTAALNREREAGADRHYERSTYLSDVP